MARQINRLTDRTIKTIKTPGLHADGGNLYLRVDESGAKRWVCIFQWEGRRKEMGLGPYSLVSLAEAREDALAARKAVHRGINPIDARKAAKAKGKAQTFGDMLNEWLAQNEGGFRNPVHRRQWRTSVETYAGSLLELPIQKITTERVLEALKPIWNEKSETASRVRQRVEKIIDAARARGLFEGENPARWKGHLDHLLPARRKLTRGHHAALPYVDAPAFMAALRARKPLSARALQFTILTAARTSEALKAKWGEFDLENKVWTVPAERMKAGKEHRVPLSDAAIEAISPQRGPEEWVFPSAKPGAPITGAAMDKQLKLLDRDDVTIHGFRSTFRDWAWEATEHPREVAEAALAHTVGDATERAYRRGDALARRRALMDAWARYVCEHKSVN